MSLGAFLCFIRQDSENYEECRVGEVGNTCSKGPQAGLEPRPLQEATQPYVICAFHQCATSAPLEDGFLMQALVTPNHYIC